MRSQVVPIRFDDSEQAMLKELAARLQRTQADTVRTLVREALSILKEQDRPPKARGAGRSQVTS